jgi:hypothetical protein
MHIKWCVSRNKIKMNCNLKQRRYQPSTELVKVSTQYCYVQGLDDISQKRRQIIYEQLRPQLFNCQFLFLFLLAHFFLLFNIKICMM